MTRYSPIDKCCKTVSAIATFYLAMTCYPEVLKRAQEEIDRVVGTDRLPSFSGRSKLPYVEALMKETLRWENVVPVSMYNHSFITRKYVSGFAALLRLIQIYRTRSSMKTHTWIIVSRRAL